MQKYAKPMIKIKERIFLYLFLYFPIFRILTIGDKLPMLFWGRIMNIKNLKETLSTLKNAQKVFDINADNSLQSMIADSCVKRFEYTLETAIKLMRKVLKNEYTKEDVDLTINNIFRLMNSYGFINSWNNWKNYFQQRNDTSHEYNIEKSRELIKIIPSFIEDCEFLVQRLENKFNQEPYFKIISEIIRKHNSDNVEFFAYGSRVKGSFQASSDLDILIKGDISPKILQTILEEIDSSDIPFIVHFSNYEDMNSDFFESIKNDLVEL